MTDKTVREELETAVGRTIREESSPVGAGTTREVPTQARTQREARHGDTVLEGANSARNNTWASRIWLPKALAERFELLEAMPTLGSEADLYIVRNKAGTRFVAKIYRRNICPKEDILALLKRADQRHVVRLEEYGEEDGCWWELLEYIEQSSLRLLMDTKGPKLQPAQVKAILKELNDALTHLHGLPIEHRDLKPDNVLIRSSSPLDLVLADFGIASIMNASRRFTDTARTIIYAPPEAMGSLVSKEEGGVRNVVTIVRTRWDYWSLGMMLVEMLTGDHPYAGISEAAASHRLATQDVDELVTGIDDAGWRKLCRGLLRRNPTKRWGSQQVKLWLANERDPNLAVEDEVPPTMQQARGIDFDGKRFTTPEALGVALAEDWSKAESFWTRRFKDLQTWVTDTLGQSARGKILSEIDKNPRLKRDAQIFSAIYTLAPGAPPRYKGVSLSASNIKAIVSQAIAGDATAKAVTLALHNNDILGLAGNLDQGDAPREIARNWNAAVAHYQRHRDELNVHNVRVPPLEGDTLITLLAAATPVDHVMDTLGTAARQASTADAAECDWFNSLVLASNTSAAALMIIPHVIREAESGARRRRYDNTLEVHGPIANFLWYGSLGMLMGLGLAILPGFLVYLIIAAISDAYVANTIAALWIMGWGVSFGFANRSSPQQFIGNQKMDHLAASNKANLYYLGSTVIIGIVLIVGGSIASDNAADQRRRDARIQSQRQEAILQQQRVRQQEQALAQQRRALAGTFDIYTNDFERQRDEFSVTKRRDCFSDDVKAKPSGLFGDLYSFMIRKRVPDRIYYHPSESGHFSPNLTSLYAIYFDAPDGNCSAALARLANAGFIERWKIEQLGAPSLWEAAPASSAD